MKKSEWRRPRRFAFLKKASSQICQFQRGVLQLQGVHTPPWTRLKRVFIRTLPSAHCHLFIFCCLPMPSYCWVLFTCLLGGLVAQCMVRRRTYHREFDRWSGCDCITTLGKLFTPSPDHTVASRVTALFSISP